MEGGTFTMSSSTKGCRQEGMKLSPRAWYKASMCLGPHAQESPKLMLERALEIHLPSLILRQSPTSCTPNPSMWTSSLFWTIPCSLPAQGPHTCCSLCLECSFLHSSHGRFPLSFRHQSKCYLLREALPVPKPKSSSVNYLHASICCN